MINKKEPFVLFLGDFFVLVFSLWLVLVIRNLEIPSLDNWLQHFVPFSFMFIFWLLNFYIFGLYEKHTLILKRNLTNIIFNVQIINITATIIFFYFIPYFQITPKTILFIYLIVSLVLILIWRLKIFPSWQKTIKQNAILIGSGQEMEELYFEINNNNRYDFYFDEKIDLQTYNPALFKDDLIKFISEKDISLVVIDIKNVDDI